jgi:2-haloacid dehalogenase
VVFDVNGTLSDMAGMGARFIQAGAPAYLADVWFAGLLRDGFALIASGGNEPFARIGAQNLRALLRDVPLVQDVDEAVRQVMEGFAELGLHEDSRPGIRALRESGYRLVTLSNGSAEVARRLFVEAGIEQHFEALLSVENARQWKPARAAYDYAARVCETEPEEMLLVAAHPWDIHGASRAGLRTAWLNRTGAPYPDYFDAPDYTLETLAELVPALGSSGPR